MTKLSFFRGIFLKTATSASLIAIAFFFNACNKDVSKPTLHQEAKIEEATKKVTSNFPQCPDGYHWDVTLAECVEDCQGNYIFCPEVGYCVPDGTCGNTPEINISSTQNSVILPVFQGLNVNFYQLSSALGLSQTLSSNDIDFQNLSRSYITNDNEVGEAIVAPFKTNSNSNTTNYVFCITVDANNTYKPFIIKSVTNQYLQYFDLDEGYILTINNYNNINAISFQTTTGNYVTNSFAARAASCGEATMNCVADAYTNHGWASVWAFVQTAFIPHTAAAIAGACAVKNCLPRL